MNLYLDILKQYWGFTAFRPLQAAIIRSVCDGKDTLGLMPTGGGKSITFQVPAMTMEGVCLVVTPLIALMRDQVERLRQIGIPATAVHSEMSREEIARELNQCISRKYKFLYLSPERLENTLFLEKLQAMSVCLLVVDESHCISQWGYDFRPAYLRIADLRRCIPDVPVLALTATATPDVADDIQNRLLFRKKNMLQTSFFRPNLAYIVYQTENKRGALIRWLNHVPGTAIIYTRNREQTQETALFLQHHHIAAESFHAGLTREEKTARQARWKRGVCRVMVATNAFGMGIDKADVRLVVHLDMPHSLEEYFQEAGRAGRDGEKAGAVALCAPNECLQLQKQFQQAHEALNKDTSAAEKAHNKRAQRRIQKVIEYISCHHICRSRFLLDYFGEKGTSTCGCCDICRAKQPSGLSHQTFNQIRTQLEKELTASSPTAIRELMLRLPYPAEISITVIRFLLDNDERFRLQDGKLQLKNLF